MGSNQTQSLTLPKETLEVTYSGGTVSGSASCVMAEPATIDIHHDYNYVPIKAFRSYDTNGSQETLDGTTCVYRYRTAYKDDHGNWVNGMSYNNDNTKIVFTKFVIDV